MIVMLSGYDVIHEAFTRQADVFTDRPQLFAPLIGVTKGTGMTACFENVKSIVEQNTCTSRYIVFFLIFYICGLRYLHSKLSDSVRVLHIQNFTGLTYGLLNIFTIHVKLLVTLKCVSIVLLNFPEHCKIVKNWRILVKIDMSRCSYSNLGDATELLWRPFLH